MSRLAFRITAYICTPNKIKMGTTIWCLNSRRTAHIPQYALFLPKSTLYVLSCQKKCRDGTCLFSLRLSKSLFAVPMSGVLSLASKIRIMVANVSSAFWTACICTSIFSLPPNLSRQKGFRDDACLFSLASKIQTKPKDVWPAFSIDCISQNLCPFVKIVQDWCYVCSLWPPKVDLLPADVLCLFLDRLHIYTQYFVLSPNHHIFASLTSSSKSQIEEQHVCFSGLQKRHLINPCRVCFLDLSDCLKSISICQKFITNEMMFVLSGIQNPL
jgi:hypothetical protein